MPETIYRWLTVASGCPEPQWVQQVGVLTSDAAARMGTRVRELREAHGLTQEALAEQVGITRNHLQLLELGVSNRRSRTPANPRLSTLAALSRALDVRFDIVMTAESGLVVEFVPTTDGS